MKTILVAEDDEDDRFLLKEALDACGWNEGLDFVTNGEELMKYLRRTDKPEDSETIPNLILLDLRMPKKSGQEALQEIKASKQLRAIPVVVLTTSNIQEDIEVCSNLGASGYLVKPGQFSGWVALAREILTGLNWQYPL